MTTPRIAYLLKKFPRLSETFILNELLGLEEQGVPLRVLSRRTPDDEPRHPELARLKAPIEVLPSSRSLDPWTPLFDEPDDGEGESLLNRLGDVVRSTRRFGHERMPSLLGEAVHLRARCRELSIDHLHVHFATDAAIVAHLVHALGGPTYSVTLHAKDIYRAGPVVPELLRQVILDSAFCVTVCQANLRYLVDTLGEEITTRLRCHYNGIDLAALQPTTAPRDEDHLLAVGRLVEKKGFDDLIEAMALVVQQRPQCRLTLVGQGDQQQALEELIAHRGLTEQITMTGPKDQGQVRELMARATVFALPCVIGEDGNRDALPTVLLEALAAGLPVVSTPVTGIPEIVDSGRAGLLVPEHDPEALADSILRLLGDEALRKNFAASGRLRAEQLFDMHSNAATLANWMTSALPTLVPPC